MSTTEIKYNETFPASSDFVLTLFSSHEMEETLITAGTSRHPHHCTSCNHLVILCLFSTSRKSSSIKKHLERLVLRIFLQPRDRKLLIAAGTSLASTVDAFYHFLLPEVLGDPADASGGEVVISCLYAAEAAEALITWLQKDSRKLLARSRI